MKGLERSKKLFHETNLFLEIASGFFTFVLLTFLLWNENTEKYHIDGTPKIYPSLHIEKYDGKDSANSNENDEYFE